MTRCVYIANETVSLVDYQECDNRALYENELDPDTQKGYNNGYVSTFEEFVKEEITQRFFAMILLNATQEIIGAVGISPLDMIADLAIWMFKPYRRHGYGTSAFALLTKYATDTLHITDLHAGVYPDNIGSWKMLEKCGYVPCPASTAKNEPEKHFLTDEELYQLDYVSAHD